MLPRVTAFVSAMVIFVPQAVTVPKLFVALPRVTLPAAAESELMKLAVPVTEAAPVWVITPPALTVRFVAEIVPSVKALVSLTLIFVPLARMVPKLFVALVNVISLLATRLATPVTLAALVCVREPVEFTVKFVVLMAGKARFTPVMLRLSSDLVEPIAPPRLTNPAPALIVR